MRWIIILVLIHSSSEAGFREIPPSNRYMYNKNNPKKAQKKTVLKSGKNILDEHTKTLLKKDQAILELLKKSQRRVIVRKKDEKITALTRVHGIVLNSVLAMSVKPSKFIVRVNSSSSEINGAELRCLGYSFEKRVPSKCDLLVIDDEEFSVDVDIWDLDGAEGIIADYYYSGEEKTFLTSSFASFLGATFDVAKGGVSSPFGTFNQNSAKNKIMDGLSSIATNAKSKVIESGEKNLTISYVNSGKEVLIFFNKSLKLNGE